jgi:hypothetical protein
MRFSATCAAASRKSTAKAMATSPISRGKKTRGCHAHTWQPRSERGEAGRPKVVGSRPGWSGRRKAQSRGPPGREGGRQMVAAGVAPHPRPLSRKGRGDMRSGRQGANKFGGEVGVQKCNGWQPRPFLREKTGEDATRTVGNLGPRREKAVGQQSPGGGPEGGRHSQQARQVRGSARCWRAGSSIRGQGTRPEDTPSGPVPHNGQWTMDNGQWAMANAGRSHNRLAINHWPLPISH